MLLPLLWIPSRLGKLSVAEDKNYDLCSTILRRLYLADRITVSDR